MSSSHDKWFEVWFDQGSELWPVWFLVVIPDLDNPGLVQVYDPFEKRIIHKGQNYEDTCLWLAEDEYSLVSGRIRS